MSFALNQVIGNYECLGIIDKPRTGVTYKVRNLTTGELESLRALPGAASRDPESAERLLREIRLQTRLTHPNVIEFHDAFEMDGHLVMTTDYVEGLTLAELCRTGPLPPRDAIAAIIQVLDGLEEAHAMGIVHRGITAEHVIVGADGGAKLGGFDLARAVADTNLTRVGTVIGDPRYISPEQVTGQGTVDGRSDLYSVGVLLYQMLTRTMPFEARNDFEVLAAQISSEPQPPSVLNPAISAELDRIVLKSLKKNPGERFLNAKEFRAALAAAAETATQPTSRVVQDRTQRPFATPLRLVLLAASIGVVVIFWVAIH